MLDTLTQQSHTAHKPIRGSTSNKGEGSSKVQKIPSVIKPFVFARGNLSFVGEFDLAELPRVKELVIRGSAVHIRMQFALVENKIIANGQLTFDAYMACANCLEEMVYSCDTPLELVFTSQPDTDKSGRECIEIVDTFTEFDTLEFVAEEVLLNIPMFVKHDYDCIELKQEADGERANTQKPLANLKDFIQKG